MRLSDKMYENRFHNLIWNFTRRNYDWKYPVFVRKITTLNHHPHQDQILWKIHLSQEGIASLLLCWHMPAEKSVYFQGTHTQGGKTLGRQQCVGNCKRRMVKTIILVISFKLALGLRIKVVILNILPASTRNELTFSMKIALFLEIILKCKFQTVIFSS